MLKSGKTMTAATKGCSYGGCSCHNPKRLRRKGKKSVKQAEKRAWKRDNDLS